MVPKKRNNISSKYIRLSCKKYTKNIVSRSVTMIKIKQKLTKIEV